MNELPKTELDEDPTIHRDRSGLVEDYDRIIGNMWSSLDSDDPIRQTRAKELARVLGFDQHGDGK